MKVVLFVDHEVGYRIAERVLCGDIENVEALALVTTLENGARWWRGVEPLARRAGIPFLRFDPRDVGNLSAYDRADYFFLLSWKHLMPRSVLDIPRHGAVNLHYSLLPRFRGVYPANWAIIEGEKQTGISFHRVDDSIDGGPVIFRAESPIFAHDTARSLQTRLDDLAVRSFGEMIAMLQAGPAPAASSAPALGEYYSRERFLASNLIDLDAVVRTGDLINLLRGKTFHPEGRNAYFIDPNTGRKIFLSLLLDPED